MRCAGDSERRVIKTERDGGVAGTLVDDPVGRRVHLEVVSENRGLNGVDGERDHAAGGAAGKICHDERIVSGVVGLRVADED